MAVDKVFGPNDFPVAAAVVDGRTSVVHGLMHHPELEIQFVFQGQCKYFVCDSSYHLKKNTALVIRKNEVHNFIGDPDSILKRFGLVFSPKLFESEPDVIDIINYLCSIRYFTLPEKAAVMSELILEEIVDERKNRRPYWESIAKSNVERLLVVLRRAADAVQFEMPRDNLLMREVISYLHKNFAERISLSEVASRFNISSCHLSREFKQHVGVGFREYLIHTRIVEAKKLLKETDWKIITICAMVGFDDVSTFYRNFRMLTGMSPASYRKISH